MQNISRFNIEWLDLVFILRWVNCQDLLTGSLINCFHKAMLYGHIMMCAMKTLFYHIQIFKLTLTPGQEFLRIFFPRGQNPPKQWSATPGIWTPDLLKTGRPTFHYTTALCYAWLSIRRQAYSLGPFFHRKTFTPGGTRIILCKILWYLEVLGLMWRHLGIFWREKNKNKNPH